MFFPERDSDNALGSFPDWKRLENRFFCLLHKKQQAPLLEATAQTMNFNLKSLALLQANLKRISGKQMNGLQMNLLHGMDFLFALLYGRL